MPKEDSLQFVPVGGIAGGGQTEITERETEGGERRTIPSGGGSLSIEARLERIERVLSRHQHTGFDESSNFEGETEFIGKSFVAKGVGVVRANVYSAGFAAVEGGAENEKDNRRLALGIVSLRERGTPNEQIQSLLVSGKAYTNEDVPSNLATADFAVLNEAELILVQVPNMSQLSSGPSSFPPFAFLIGVRTPFIQNVSGAITTGGNTLTDSSAAYKPNQLAGSVLNVLANVGGQLLLGETFRITGNTTNVITVNGSWSLESGTYAYQVVTPIFLGSADRPFSRLFVGEDIRLGYGSSGGAQVQYIKWGSGSPEGVVPAQVGSLFLSSTGGLFVKQSGTGKTGWVQK